MATDRYVMSLVGRTWPTGLPPAKRDRCPYCGARLRVVGCWHPEGGPRAYVVLGCERCRSTENGGKP